MPRIKSVFLSYKKGDRLDKLNAAFTNDLFYRGKSGVIFSFWDIFINTDSSDIQRAEFIRHTDYQSSSRMADKPSASSTQDASYFVFFIGAPHAGQILYGLSQIVLHAEQIYSSARKRCVRCIQ